MLYAEVVVQTRAPYRHPFTYSIPEDLTLAPGQGVLVPFGPRILPGIVLTVGSTAQFDGTIRAVQAPAPAQPSLLPHQLELARWLAEAYLAPLYACVALMLPPDVQARVVRRLRLTERGEAAAEASPLIERLRSAGGSLPLSSLRRLGSRYEAEGRRLLIAGLVEETQDLLARDPLAERNLEARGGPPLTGDQRRAVRQVLGDEAGRGRPPVTLLYGVTGSGKTEVYLAAVAATLARGRRGIVLVPEIALTPQTVERFAGRFPDRVAVLHSGLSPGQRHDQWCAVRDGRFDVVVGSRSALFAPQPDLGLIVVDEEHEWTYKQQDPPPRYQTRAAAERLAEITGARVVLGSATPDIVSYYSAVKGRYALVELPERVRPNAERGIWLPDSLPSVEVVDLARELREGNRGIFSRALIEALRATLAAGEQAILFLNHRGSASFILCRDCGHVPHCRRCSVSLTYHGVSQRLICHQCNRSRRVPDRCPACRGSRIRYLGLGTQRVEDEVRRQFPAARVLRWDRDIARRAGEHTAIFDRLNRGEADILVGTQMIAKGLDLSRVTLAGVVNADISLNLPDYRSGERAFQVLTQVAGRPGRRQQPGRVILQTYAPNHYVIRAAARHDYGSFYAQELEFRRRSAYPPFVRLARLIYAHSGQSQAEGEARRLALQLRGLIAERSLISSEILGPVPCLVARLRGRWRWQLLLRGPEPERLLHDVPLPAGWSVDFDPQSFT